MVSLLRLWGGKAEAMTLIMKVGQQITCENGHEIAVAKEDIDTADHHGVMRSESFDWKMGKPNRVLTPCPLCGAAYIKRVSWLGYRPHTPEGWVE